MSLIHSIFQFILFFLYKKIVPIWSIFSTVDHLLHGRPTSIPRDQRSLSFSSCVRRARWFLIPSGAWIIGRSLRVRHGPWRLHTAFREKGPREEGDKGESRERVYRQGSLDPLASGPVKALIYEWDQTPRGGQRCRLAEPGTTLVPGSTNRWLVSPLSSRLFPLFALSFSFSFLLLAQLPISIPHHLPSFSFSFFNFFLFSRSLVLVAEDALTLVACVLLGTYLSSIMRRRLSWNYCGQIGRVLLSSWFLLPD